MNWKLILYLIPVIVGGIAVGMFEEGRLAKETAKLKTCEEIKKFNGIAVEKLNVSLGNCKKTSEEVYKQKDETIAKLRRRIEGLCACQPNVKEVRPNGKGTEVPTGDTVLDELNRMFL